MLPHLPVEIYGLIVDEVSCGRALRQIRLVNSTLCALATPSAFRCAFITNTAAGVQKFTQLLDCDYLACYVREVVYEDVHARPASEQEIGNAYNYDMRFQLTEALKQIGAFPNLRALTFVFTSERDLYSVWVPSPGHILTQFCAIATLNSIADALTGRLHHLALDGLIPHYHVIYSHPPLLTLLASLRTLRISTAAAQADLSQWSDFWLHNVQDDIMRGLAPAPALTRLVLRSANPAHDHPALEVDELAFLALEELAVPHMVVGSDEFVERHPRLQKWNDGLRAWSREAGWHDARASRGRALQASRT
ncbi:hypothetical protein FA95DRAFT_1367655 [Auriscalpium vulgare]|uniref:Uncharacterized protein n=1 Tax=Auriscalpium vulgare TaxID=40419 RepID=A0ACB8RRV5_9AGAM|nr:hypothetical protein FA95DRAFT_1367655 [Auriscalpium vulgare]